MASELPNFVPGEPFDARKLEKLNRQVSSNTPMRGAPGVRVTRRPWGWSAAYSSSSSFAPQIWRVTMTGGYPKNLSITIGAGLVNGVAPVIPVNGVDVPIAGNPGATPPVQPPSLAIPQSAFDSTQGQACLYLQATMNAAGGYPNVANWWLQRVAPVALPGLPPATPYTAWKLLGFFILANGGVTYRQMCYFNLGLGTVFTRTASGAARYVWYAT